MSRARRLSLACALSMAVLPVAPAMAQPLGTFSWQLQPFCNVLTFSVAYSVSPTGGQVYTLDGYDDLCGAATRAAASGVAFPNPDGSIGMGVSIVTGPDGEAFHLDARLNLASLSGTWVGEGGIGGVFSFNTATGGAPRPPSGAAILLTQYGAGPRILTRRAQGSVDAPEAVLEDQVLGSFGGGGYTGSGFTGAMASMLVSATEDWTPTEQGSRLSFMTTSNGSISPAPRMTIEASGNVGIGTVAPLNLLHVNGAIRVGSCTIQTDGNILCVSDARYKRDIKALPRMLDRLAGLEPVRYSWRADEFPDMGFNAGESFGLVAQDVEAVLPELVTTDEMGFKAVNYGRLPLLTVQALKEMKSKLEATERENAALAARLAALEAAIAQLQRQPQ